MKTNAERVLGLLRKNQARYKFKDLARLSRLTHPELEEAIAEIRQSVPNLVYAKFDRTYYLSAIPTSYSNQTDLSRELPLEGSIGVISDTHIGSDAERLDLINHAYDVYAERGITHVLHAGDLTDGIGVYRGHNQFVKVFGGAAQAVYFIKNYPRRPGIKTYAISGNHDLSTYLQTGMDQAALISTGLLHEGKWYDGRDDIVYLGQYAHRVIFPQEVVVELIHPRGNSSYAKSYKQQKRSEAMSRDLRPDVQISGHFHDFNFTWINGSYFVACHGLQDETEFQKRLGLPRGMGFMILHYRIKNARLVSLSPEIFVFV